MAKWKYMIAHLEFAKKPTKDSQSMRNKILWSDETTIGLNAKCHVWRKPGTIPMVKHSGGSIMIWGCFSVAVTGRLATGKMNRAKYREILEAPEHSGPQTSDFQHDNDTAKTTQEWLRDKSLNVPEWPSQSLDLNPIKLFWRDLKLAVQRRSPSNLTELERIYREEWEKFPKYRCADRAASPASPISSSVYRNKYK